MRATREGRFRIIAAVVMGLLVTTAVGTIAAERWRLVWDPNPEDPVPTNGPTAGYLVRWSGESRTSATYRGRTGSIRVEGRATTNGPVVSNLVFPIFATVVAFGPSGIEGPEGEELFIPETTRTSTNILSPIDLRLIR